MGAVSRFRSRGALLSVGTAYKLLLSTCGEETWEDDLGSFRTAIRLRLVGV